MNKNRFIQTKTLNMEKQEPPGNRTEKQNTENRKIKHPSNTKQLWSQKDKINLELARKIMTEKITLLSFRNQDWKKKVQVKTGKDKQIITTNPYGEHHWTKRVKETCSYSVSSEKPSANIGVKNLHGVK